MDEIIPGSQKWAEIRRTLITATDMTVLMGVHKWGKTPRVLYDQKMSGLGDIVTPSMERGLYLEVPAREVFQEITGHKVSPRFIISDDYVWAGASLDGYNDEGVIVELKCSGKEDHEAALKGEVPAHYYPQIQWQMVVTGQKESYYMSYHPGQEHPTAIVRCSLDEEYAKVMITKGLEFLECLKNEMPPGATDDDYIFIDDEDFLEKEKIMDGLLQKQGCIKEEISSLRAYLLRRCDAHKSKGNFLNFTPYLKKGTIDLSKIPELKGVDLEPYRKPPKASWRVTRFGEREDEDS